MKMAKAAQEQIWVWLDDPTFGPLQHIGTLSRGDRGSVRFAYNQTWLKHAHAFPLDPELDISPGEFFPCFNKKGYILVYKIIPKLTLPSLSDGVSGNGQRGP
jgi:serine/threonine-protein kinase HipA